MTVADAFTHSQKTTACHKKYILALSRYKRDQDAKDFQTEFKQCLNSALLVFKREPAVCKHRFLRVPSTLTRVRCAGGKAGGFHRQIQRGC